MTTDSKTAHGRQVERVLWIVLVLNLVVAASKYFYGLASGSIPILRYRRLSKVATSIL